MRIAINALNIKSGGGIKHIYNILKEAKSLKSDIEYVLITHKELASKIKKLQIKNLKIIIIDLNNFLLFFWKIFFLNKLLYKNNCDSLYSPDGIFFIKYKKNIVFYQNLIPFLFNEIIKYGFSLQTLKLYFIRYLYKLSAVRADGLIFLNEYGKRLILKQFELKSKKNLAIIPHGIDKFFYKVKKKNNIIKNLIYISPIDLYKNQWKVARAVKELNKDGYNLKLHIVGSVSNQKAAKLFFLEKINDPNIIYHGELSDEKIFKLLNKIDLYIFASSCESMGLTLLEGMATNLPVISSNSTGMDKTLNCKKSNFIPENVLSIKKTLLYFLKNKKFSKKNASITTKNSLDFNWKICSHNTFLFLKSVSKIKKQIKEKKNNFFNFIKLKKIDYSNYVYAINFYTPILFFFFKYFFGKNFETLNYILTYSLTNIFISIFSLNSRNILLSSKSSEVLNSFIIFRIFISLFLMFVSFIFNQFFDLIYLNVYVIIFILGLWIAELFIVKLDIENQNKKTNLLFFFQILLLLFSFILFFTGVSFAFVIINHVLLLFLFLFLLNAIKVNLSYKLYSFKVLINQSYFFSNLLSTFLIVLSIFIIRWIISINFENTFSLDVIMCFTLATFPSTLMTNTYGNNYISGRANIPFYAKFTFIIYFIILLIILLLRQKINYSDYTLKLLFFSLIGSYIFFLSQLARLSNIIEANGRLRAFSGDIIYSLIAIVVIFLLSNYFFVYFYASFLILSFVALFIYLDYPFYNLMRKMLAKN